MWRVILKIALYGPIWHSFASLVKLFFWGVSTSRAAFSVKLELFAHPFGNIVLHIDLLKKCSHIIPHMTHKCEVKLWKAIIFSFISSYFYMRAWFKELRRWSYFQKICVAKKQLTTTHKVVGETILNRVYIFSPSIKLSIFCAYSREPNLTFIFD